MKTQKLSTILAKETNLVELLGGGKTLQDLAEEFKIKHPLNGDEEKCTDLLKQMKCVRAARKTDEGKVIRWYPPPPGKGGQPGDNDEWSTPREDFAIEDSVYNFTIDLSATAENTKCRRFYSKEDDALTKSWDGEMAWNNPPFSNIGPFVEKARDVWERESGGVVQLLPNWTDRKWWHQFIEPLRVDSKIRVKFLEGRTRFGYPGNEAGEGTYDSSSFGLVKVYWTRW